MFRKNDVLPSIILPAGCTYAHPPQPPQVIYQEDPALFGMLDLLTINMITISPDDPMRMARNEMEAADVHQLLVTEDDRLVGIISLADILGSKPLQIIEEKRVERHNLLVKDVMISYQDILTFKLEDVKIAKMRNVVASLNAKQQQYALVADINKDNGGIIVRGLFSSHHLIKHLGQDTVNDNVSANTLAELKQHLGSN
jgi:CBS domain-containing protein